MARTTPGCPFGDCGDCRGLQRAVGWVKDSRRILPFGSPNLFMKKHILAIIDT
jgi:hypothetical protein